MALLKARSFLASDACASDALIFVFTTAMSYLPNTAQLDKCELLDAESVPILPKAYIKHCFKSKKSIQ